MKDNENDPVERFVFETVSESQSLEKYYVLIEIEVADKYSSIELLMLTEQFQYVNRDLLFSLAKPN